MAEHEECSICADTEPDDLARITLACGHTFHCKCAIEWFRYENVTCPNCRSDHTRNVWCKRTPSQRIASMRRRSHLEPILRRKVTAFDGIRKTLVAAKQAYKQFKLDNKDVLKQNRNLCKQIRDLRKRETRMKFELGTSVCPSVPLIHMFDYDAEDSNEEEV